MTTAPASCALSGDSYVCIEVYWTGEDGEPPFICGVHGRITVACLTEIEVEMADDTYRYLFVSGEGDYVFAAFWQPPQYGDEGRVELPGYWELAPVAQRPADPAQRHLGG